MAFYRRIDPTNITTGSTTPSLPISPANAGLLHNNAIYRMAEFFENNSAPSRSDYKTFVMAKANAAETSTYLPSGSSNFVESICDVLVNATSTTTFSSIISDIQTIHNSIIGNPTYSTSQLATISSIALNSAKLWSEAINSDTGNPPTFPLFWGAIFSDLAGVALGVEEGWSTEVTVIVTVALSLGGWFGSPS